MPTEVIRQNQGVFSVRIYDATPTTPNYVFIPFVQGDFSGELRTPRPPGITRLDRGIINAYAHVLPGSDEFLAQGIPYTFSFWLDTVSASAVLAAMSNPFEDTITAGAWPVGAGDFLTAAGTGAQIYNTLGALVDPTQVADVRHVRVHVEALHDNQIGGADYGWRFEECHFESIVVTVGIDASPARVTFRRFGKLTEISAFTAGASLTPAV